VVGGGWQASPSHYSVSIHGYMLVGEGGGGGVFYKKNFKKPRGDKTNNKNNNKIKIKLK
jgi:hypothetical protein